jgi:hypothetical protein
MEKNMFDFSGVDTAFKILFILAIIAIITTPLALWKLIEIGLAIIA